MHSSDKEDNFLESYSLALTSEEDRWLEYIAYVFTNDRYRYKHSRIRDLSFDNVPSDIDISKLVYYYFYLLEPGGMDLVCTLDGEWVRRPKDRSKPCYIN